LDKSESAFRQLTNAIERAAEEATLAGVDLRAISHAFAEASEKWRTRWVTHVWSPRQ
jgi:hypothetical protein